jgi:hypothetical protein
MTIAEVSGAAMCPEGQPTGRSASSGVVRSRRPISWPRERWKVIALRSCTGIDHLPGARSSPLESPGQPVAEQPDHEVAHRTDHEQQTECIANEPRYEDHHSADEHEQPVEQLPGRHLSPFQPLPGVSQDPEPDSPDDEGTERAHDDQERQGPEKADLPGYYPESSDLGGNHQQYTDEEHTAG